MNMDCESDVPHRIPLDLFKHQCLELLLCCTKLFTMSKQEVWGQKQMPEVFFIKQNDTSLIAWKVRVKIKNRWIEANKSKKS